MFPGRREIVAIVLGVVIAVTGPAYLRARCSTGLAVSQESMAWQEGVSELHLSRGLPLVERLGILPAEW
jgi:hypothetical protein